MLVLRVRYNMIVEPSVRFGRAAFTGSGGSSDGHGIPDEQDPCPRGECDPPPDPCEGDPCCMDPCSCDPCCVDPCSCLDCDDSDPCTTDSCSAGVCVNEPVDCDDGDPCTLDNCEKGWCAHRSVCIEYQDCCGDHCCPRDQTCCGDACCLDGQDCCNGVCCTGGTVCCGDNTCYCPTGALADEDGMQESIVSVASTCTNACSCLGTTAFCFCLNRCRLSECHDEWLMCTGNAGYSIGLAEAACAVGCVPLLTPPEGNLPLYRSCVVACGIPMALIPLYEAGVCLDQLMNCGNSANQAFAVCIANAGP